MRFEPADYGINHVMHCPTKKSWEVFTRFLNDRGYTYVTGDSFVGSPWEYAGETCLRFIGGRRGSLGFYRRSDDEYIILEFDDFDWDDEGVPELNLSLSFDSLLAGE